MKNEAYVDEANSVTDFPEVLRLFNHPVFLESRDELSESWLPNDSLLGELTGVKAPSALAALLDAALLRPASGMRG